MVLCVLPIVLIVFGVGVKFLSKYSKIAGDALATSASVTEEVLSSIRMVQAYGAERQLSQIYDTDLVDVERMGYRVAVILAFMIATLYFAVCAVYGLGFCIS